MSGFLLQTTIRSLTKPLVRIRNGRVLKLFRKKTEPLIGLDIGSTSVRLLQLSSRGYGYRIDHFAIESLNEGVVVDNTIQDVEAISNAISNAVKNSGARAKFCAIAVSGSAVFTKIITLKQTACRTHIDGVTTIWSVKNFNDLDLRGGDALHHALETCAAVGAAQYPPDIGAKE